MTKSTGHDNEEARMRNLEENDRRAEAQARERGRIDQLQRAKIDPQQALKETAKALDTKQNPGRDGQLEQQRQHKERDV